MKNFTKESQIFLLGLFFLVISLPIITRAQTKNQAILATGVYENSFYFSSNDFDYHPVIYASSGLPLQYKSDNNAVATIVNNKIHPVSTGSFVLTISQPGNGEYKPAPDLVFTVTFYKGFQSINFLAIPAKSPTDLDFDPNASATSDLPIFYTSSNPSVAVIVNNKIQIKGIGSSVITATQPGNANYSAATPKNQTLTVSPNSQTINFPAITKRFLDAEFTPTVTTSSNLPISYLTSSNTAVATVSNLNTIKIVGVGTSTITAFQNGSIQYQGANQSTLLTVNKADQTILLSSSASKTFDSPDFDPLGVASSELQVTYTSSNPAVATIVANKVHLTGIGVTTIIANQVGNAQYNPAPSVSQTLSVTKGMQYITFPGIPAKPLATPEFDPNATVSSGLTPTYTSSNTLVATINGNKVKIVGLGTTIITASQPGDNNYNPATSVSQTLIVSGSLQTIAFPSIPTKTLGDPDFNPNAIASSGLAVSYVSSDQNVAVISGNLVKIVGAGTATITAIQNGNTEYAGTSASTTLNVNRKIQTINFENLLVKKRSDAPFSPTITTSSDLAVTLSSDNPSVATISGNKIVLQGAGTANITASQIGDANYNPAPQVTRMLTVTKGIQNINFPILSPKTLLDVDFNPGTTSDSGLETVYSSSNTSVAVIVGRLVKVVGVGSTVITASQAGDDHYEPASVSRTLFVNSTQQVIDFPILANVSIGDPDFDPGASVISGLPIIYTSSNPAVASIVNNKVRIIATGTTSITASQAGNNIYSAASEVTRALTVTKRIQVINFPVLSAKTLGDADFTTGASVNSPLQLTYTSSNPNVATIVGGMIRIVAPGTTVISASQNGDSNYEAAIQVSRTLTVNGNGVQVVVIPPIADKPFNSDDFNPGALSNSGLPITYSSSNPSVATINNNFIKIVGLGTTTITATQAGSLDFAAASASTQLTVVKGNPVINFQFIPTQRMSKEEVDLRATTASNLPIVFNSSDPSVAVVVGAKIKLIGVGTSTITASIIGNANYNAASTTQTLTVQKGSQIITFPQLPKTQPSSADYDPGATANSGLPITYSSSNTNVATIINGKIHVVGLGTTTITASQPGDANYNAAQDEARTLTISKANQIISFPAISAKLIGSQDFDPGATSDSGLPVSYSSSNTAVALILGNQIRIIGLGQAIITASQSGDVNFNAATDVVRVLNVASTNQVVTMPAVISKVFGSPDFVPDVTTTSGLDVVFSSSNPQVASIVDNKIRITGAGNTVITATQLGDLNFAGASSISNLTISKADQSITFPAIPDKKRDDSSFPAGASSSSGLTIFYLSTNSDVVRVIGNRLEIVGIGSAVIIASQPGDSNYNRAQNVTQTLTVSKGNQVITFPEIPAKALADVDFDPGATVSSGFAITYTSSNPNVATIVNGKIHIVGLGNSTITASVSGNADFNAAVNVSRVLTVRGLPQTIVLNPIPTKKPSDPEFDPGATVSTNLPIIYTSSNTNVATIVNNRVRIVGVGTSTITATQAGDATYAAATASVTLTVAKLAQTINLPAIANKRVGDADFDPGATSSSGLSITYTSSNANVATIVAGKVKIVGMGTTTITANQAGTTDYEAVTASVTLTVDQTAQTITFPAISAKDFNSAEFDPGATASSGLAVSYTSSNVDVATVVAGKIKITGAGVTTITATQTGNAVYGAATPVSVQLTVNKGNQTINFPAFSVKVPGDADFDPAATASSALPITYTSSNSAVATIVNGRVRIVGSGSSVITASQPGNNNFNAATAVNQTLDVVYTLPVSNFSVKATDETCKTSNNGSINIQAVQALNYTAAVTVNGGTTTYPFNTVLAINNLQAGSYNVCITVAGQPNYKQCFDVVIKEPKDLAVYSTLKDNGNTVLLKLEGSEVYTIDVNGKLMTTTSQEILVPLTKGNNIVKISTDKTCQGVITRTFLTSNAITLFPNPVKKVLNITTGSLEGSNVKIEIHALDGRLVYNGTQRTEYGQVAVDLGNLNKGLYVLTLTIGNNKTVHKILKD